MKILIGLLVSLSAAAAPHVGVESRDGELSFVTSETNYFRRTQLNRYGYGQIRFLVGARRSGVAGRSGGGFPLFYTGNVQSSRAGLMITYDVGSTIFNWTGNDRDADYYMLMPGLGFGAYYNAGAAEIRVVPKLGVNVTNYYDKRLFHPDVYRFNGLQATMTLDKAFGFSVETLRFREDEVNSIGVFYKFKSGNEIVFRQDQFSYQDDVSMFLFNVDF